MGFTGIASHMDFFVWLNTHWGAGGAYGKMSKPNKDIKQTDSSVWILSHVCPCFLLSACSAESGGWCVCGFKTIILVVMIFIRSQGKKLGAWNSITHFINRHKIDFVYRTHRLMVNEMTIRTLSLFFELKNFYLWITTITRCDCSPCSVIKSCSVTN